MNERERYDEMKAELEQDRQLYMQIKAHLKKFADSGLGADNDDYRPWEAAKAIMVTLCPDYSDKERTAALHFALGMVMAEGWTR